MARAFKESGGPTLVAFERETIRIAPDAEVAQLRSTEPPRPGSYLWTGRDGCGRIIVTRAEAAALERLNATRKGFCSRTAGGLALSKHCGIVRVKPAGRPGAPAGALTLEILPKLWGGAAGTDAAARAAELGAARRALLRMLARATGLPISEVDMTPQASANTALLDIFVRSFLRATLGLAKHGLLTRYVEVVDDLHALRGRWLHAETARAGARRPGVYRCAHDDLIVDNPYNQALLAALEASRKSIRHASTERLWVETRAMLASVSSVRMSGREVAQLKRSRETVRYDEALRWAELLLELLAPSLAAGTAGAPALLFNMEALFERWVERHERDRAPDGMVVRYKGVVRNLATIEHGRPAAAPAATARSAFRLMPDLSVWRTGQDHDAAAPEAIIDAKWKNLDPARRDWGVDEKDVHQVLAYLTRYGCRTARLAYPVLSSVKGQQMPPNFRIDLPGGQTATIGVELVAIDA